MSPTFRKGDTIGLISLTLAFCSLTAILWCVLTNHFELLMFAQAPLASTGFALAIVGATSQYQHSTKLMATAGVFNLVLIGGFWVLLYSWRA